MKYTRIIIWGYLSAGIVPVARTTTTLANIVNHANTASADWGNMSYQCKTLSADLERTIRTDTWPEWAVEPMKSLALMSEQLVALTEIARKKACSWRLSVDDFVEEITKPYQCLRCFYTPCDLVLLSDNVLEEAFALVGASSDVYEKVTTMQCAVNVIFSTTGSAAWRHSLPLGLHTRLAANKTIAEYGSVVQRRIMNKLQNDLPYYKEQIERNHVDTKNVIHGLQANVSGYRLSSVCESAVARRREQLPLERLAYQHQCDTTTPQ
ncbi:hypothetical protein P154DRAFT_530978 [Amniculicola lignicola CBS 123094]|uniref:Uncharacterized protein n=1 Tax=Amniculicola lignicola CBS 123094 TaxID=1392246 RepID=A0A6A5WU53_9PLEO|nr:hypothetical protein P154DRAFT_530978 [Amniculicola lignicola CBS 123094]